MDVLVHNLNCYIFTTIDSNANPSLLAFLLSCQIYSFTSYDLLCLYFIEHLLTLNEEGLFKSFDELKASYSSKSITPEKEVFLYCAIGGRSGYTWFVLKYLLGYSKVWNYDGSWNEWSRLPDVAIAK
ncbi:MAG TPA: rhodanese-like domain-containing protein [Leptolyngbyaceae cyanobacterium]